MTVIFGCDIHDPAAVLDFMMWTSWKSADSSVVPLIYKRLSKL
jgi:hypothetical protein